MGTGHNRGCVLDFQALGLPQLDLSDMGWPFIETEIWEVIKDLPLDRAPGPDGFTCRFYRSCWSIIRGDVIRAFDALSSMDCRSFHHLNDGLLTLIPNKIDPSTLGTTEPSA